MEADYSQACELFNEMEPSLRAPSLNPNYVLADASRDLTLRPIYWFHTEADHIFYYPFHLSQIENTDFLDIQSQYGYGGPISNTSDPHFLHASWIDFRDWCHGKRVIAEFVRFHPVLKNWSIYNGEVNDNRDTVYIDLNNHDLFGSYSSRVRNSIRKGVKSGLIVERPTLEEFYKIFPAFYREHMGRLGVDEFYFFSDEYFCELFKKNNILPLVCYCDGNVVAAAMFLLDEINAEYHLSASTELGRKYSATNLILHKAAERLKEEGIRCLHLGGGTDSDPNNPLFFFKSGFSKQYSKFMTGKFIHNDAIYNDLKSNWEKKNGKSAQRVLFYR